MPKKKKSLVTKANYVGLTIEVKQVKEQGDIVYEVTVQYLARAWDNYTERDDMFTLEEKTWKYSSAMEAMGKFNYIKNQVRNMGKFRNLNSGKIPDYRDAPIV